MRRPWALYLTLFALLTVTFSGSALAATEEVLHIFKGTANGSYPIAPLATDVQGNLYGTTHFGGAANEGTVFELSPDSSGHYTYSEIYDFSGVGDAEQPDGGPLLVDGSGNLFGTTLYGGTNGQGVVYELSPVAGGGWTEKVIYSFGPSCCSTDGFYPIGGVVMDAVGNLYGVTENGGPNDVGTVFELSPDGSGGWTRTTLYSFTGNRNAGPDGAAPVAGVAFDAAGNLFGTTALGGRYLNGIVFELSPSQGGAWTEKVIHAFSGADGCNPAVRPVVDSAGNVYGTAANQYTDNCIGGGTVFRLSPSAQGWKQAVLHEFKRRYDGDIPNGIVLDSKGNIYGTAVLGGSALDGVVYKLTPTATGPWTESIVLSLAPGSGGALPLAGVTFGIDGNLYGTTSAFGGPYGRGSGVVFQTRP
jgi:uncharacterized repeat protein (TIGR03803 family)